MAQRELTPADYMAMVRRHWVMIAILTIIGPPLAFGTSLLLPSSYVSQTLVLVQPPSVSADVVPQIDTTDVSQRLSSMQSQILSRTRLEPIIRQFNLYPKDINSTSMEQLVGRLQKSIDITPVQAMAETKANGLPGFTVAVTLDKAQTAQQVCSAITSMFIEENLQLRQQHSQDTTQFLAQQLSDAKANLDQQDAKLAAFKSRYLGSLPDEEQTNLNILTGLTTQLDAATQALSRAQQDKGFSESMLTQQLSAWQATQTGRDPETVEQQLAVLQTQLSSLQARYTDDYPDVIKVKNDIAVLKKKIEENNDAKTASGADKTPRVSVEPLPVAQLRAQIHSFDQVISEKAKDQEQIKQQIKLYQGRIQSSPVVEQQYKELTRGYQTALDSYNELQKKRDSSAMATDLERQQQGEQFRVLDPANLPDKPSFPDRRLFSLAGLAGGLGLGLALTLVIELRNTSMRTERDVEFSLQLPVLAMVPSIDLATSKSPRRSEVAKTSRLQMNLDPRN